MKLATIATAAGFAGFAGFATLAALAISAVDLALTESTDRAVAEVCHWLHTGEGPLTVGALHASPRDLEDRAWREWSARMAPKRAEEWSAYKEHAAATRERADEDDTAAADARLFEFARGIGSHVSEDDLAIGSPAAVAAASARLD